MRPRPSRFLVLVALLLTLGPAACGDDDESPARTSGGSGDGTAEATETSPAAQREALKDTGSEPVIPRPSGSPPRRLVKEDIVRGEGPAAERGDRLTVQHAGVVFSTGAELDGSWATGRPYTFVLGSGDVIEGWNRGLVGMRKGGRRMLTIPPELGYGAQGSPPAIGPNETLVYVVDLLEIRRGRT
jgi:peptidylprolyl isomerase